jgi:D-3-phosphoglycerate dehydrogenase
MTIAIIGLGHMGRSVAQKMRGLGCQILAYDKYLSESPMEEVVLVDLKTVFEKADVVSLHLPLSEETRYFADINFFQSFQKPFYFINTARGQHCSTHDLLTCLNENKIKGAALDVLEFESTQLKVEYENSNVYHQLIQHPKVILTPHIAGWTVESYYQLSKVLSDKIRSYYSLGF